MSSRGWRSVIHRQAVALSRSGGRQPAVGTVSSRGWRSVIHRQPVALSRSGGRQPAVVRVSHRQHRTLLAKRGCWHTTGGLRPPLLVLLQCGHSPTKLRPVRSTTARLQERRASARRGNETHLQWPAFFPDRVRSRTTAGLRQPLLVHGVGRPKNNDICGAQTHVSKSGGCQPAVVYKTDPAP
jgi:hypothetical protein